MGLSEIEKQACGYVSEREVVELTRLLVSIPSFSGEASPITSVLADYLQRQGFKPRIVGPAAEYQSVIAGVEGEKPESGLLLSGHLDTVPVGNEEWTVSPFEGKVVDGSIYGRGAADMKGGLAAVVSGATAVMRLGVILNRGLDLAFTADEEVGSIRGMKYLCEQGQVGGMMGIAAEPTSLEVQGWFKGRARYEVKTLGRAAHSSDPDRGVNAIVKLANLITRLSRGGLSQIAHPMLGVATLNVGIIEGGVDANTVPDRARTVVEVRTVPGQTSESILEELRGIIGSAKSDDPDLVAEVDLLFAKEPMEIDKTDPVVEEIRRVTKDLMGRPAPYGREPIAGGDMYYAWRLCGTRGVDFGPGDLGMAHAVDEKVTIDKLVLAAKAYAVLILRLCGARLKR